MWGRALRGTNLFCGLPVIVQGYGDPDPAALAAAAAAAPAAAAARTQCSSFAGKVTHFPFLYSLSVYLSA